MAVRVPPLAPGGRTPSSGDPATVPGRQIHRSTDEFSRLPQFHGTKEVTAMDYRLELVLIPVSDVDRAKRFYVEQAGFDLLVDTPTGLPGPRVVQVAPPGAAWSF